MSDLSSTTGIVALAAGGAAILCLVALAVVLRRLRRLQADQRVILGEEQRDLTAHSADLERQFSSLHDYVVDVVTRVEARVDGAEQRLDGAIAHRAVVRYDAYNEMSGRQSTSIALLDAHQSGVVLSSIHHRDQARIYVKQVQDGTGAIQLSPEEQQAVTAAMASENLDLSLET